MSVLSVSAEEIQKALELHNEARREAPGPLRPDLVWSNTLAAAAEEWGKKMVRNMRRQGQLQHDPRLLQKPYTMGENLFGGEGGTMTLSTATRGWIREKSDYKGDAVTANGRNRKGVMVGHYTQIICPGTTKVGMVKIQSGDWLYIVARYDGPQVTGSLPWGDPKDIALGRNETLSQGPVKTPAAVAGPSANAKPTRSLPDQEIQKILDLHNEARREAPGGPRPDLVWSETLFTAAEKWAKELARRNRGPKHADQSKMGENIAWSQNNVMSYSTAVRLWTDENRFYRGERVGDEDPSGKPIGHYTQIIYQQATKVGMARVTRGSETFIVARYDKMQTAGSRPWGSATRLPAGANEDRGGSSRAQHSQSGLESPRTHHQQGNTASYHSPRGGRSLVEDVIDSMPRLVIKNSKISFHPFGKKRSKAR